ncbi:MAG: 4Fe-4S binding protein [bacterium]|nr:MAG: 4Fe-4S binding protein [bacterium]
MLRQIITIDEEKCDGCGQCVPNCPEGALQIIDGKARLVNDLFCDGLGACIGHCPLGAITIEEREAEEYDENMVMENIVKQGDSVVKAHLEHLRDHGLTGYVREAINYLIERDLDVPEEFRSPNGAIKSKHGEHSRPEGAMLTAHDRSASAHSGHGNPHGTGAGMRHVDAVIEVGRSGNEEVNAPQHDSDSISQPGVTGCGCPGSRVIDLGESDAIHPSGAEYERRPSRLRQWPVQIMLVPPFAPYLQGADLLIAADCVPFAFPDFHEELLNGKIVLVGCPKLDDAGYYTEKLTQVFKQNDIKSVTVAHMEVPCCFGMLKVVRDAITSSGKEIPLQEINISIRGERIG